MRADHGLPRTLSELLRDVPGASLLSGNADAPVTGLSFDSRRVSPGNLFVAVNGLKQDGRAYVSHALERGAVAVAAEAPVPPGEAARIRVPDSRAALADFAASWYGHPSRQITLIGITGTDGKSSVSQLSAAVLEAAGHSTGWLTTVDLKIGSERRASPFQHTTPEAPGVQGFLSECVDAGVEIALLEVSSHALALERVRGCAFDMAIFTNLSPEHLNFHGTMREYRDAKARLFRALDEPTEKSGQRYGVVNADDPESGYFRCATSASVLTYGIDQPANVRARDVVLGPHGARFLLTTPVGETFVESRLLGRFNVSNWLAAAAAAHGLGIGPEAVARAAREVHPIRGRMEPIDRGQPFAVVVDFAHTPQALRNALVSLRQHTSGRLMVVFGNAGERDPASRPAMGRVAAELTDYFVISMDDPLFEDPPAIAAEAAEGARAAGAAAGRDFTIELDRSRAIRLLLERARPGDAVLLAGKGHEQRMLVRDQRLPWSDRDVAETQLREMGH